MSAMIITTNIHFLSDSFLLFSSPFSRSIIADVRIEFLYRVPKGRKRKGSNCVSDENGRRMNPEEESIPPITMSSRCMTDTAVLTLSKSFLLFFEKIEVSLSLCFSQRKTDKEREREKRTEKCLSISKLRLSCALSMFFSQWKSEWTERKNNFHLFPLFRFFYSIFFFSPLSKCHV